MSNLKDKIKIGTKPLTNENIENSLRQISPQIVGHNPLRGMGPKAKEQYVREFKKCVRIDHLLILLRIEGQLIRRNIETENWDLVHKYLFNQKCTAKAIHRLKL